MSLMRQVALLLLTVLVLALGASVAVSVDAVRQTLQTQLQIKNSDNAAALALAMSQQKGDESLMSLLVSAQFDTGYYQSLRWKRADGRTVFERVSAEPLDGVPAWFVRALPIEVEPGVAQVSNGWSALGSVEVRSHTSYAHAALWESVWKTVAWLVALSVLTGGLAFWALRFIRRPLDAAVRQAQALVQGEFVHVDEPAVPELARLTRALNTMVAKIQAMFEAQKEQLTVLQAQVHCDSLTGLSLRKHFLAEFSSALSRDEGPLHAGLILLRLRDLQGLNQRLGHAQVDQVIQALAKFLKTYPDRVRGCLAGRLNGADFALWLHAPDVVRDTAAALADMLRSGLPHLDAGVSVAMAAVDLPRASLMSQWFGEADAVLAHAETGQGVSLAFMGAAQLERPVQGERIWRSQIKEALQAGRARLHPFPVIDKAGQLLHWECPLQLQLLPQGEYLQAAQWLPLALRSRLSAEADLKAVQLALEGINEDGQVRCVNVAPSSLEDGAFMPRVRDLIFQTPQAARKLGLELAEVAALQHFDALHELGRQLRPLGVQLGLEHASAGLTKVDRLFQAGLDYVKLDASVVSGVSGDAGRAAFVRGMVIMLRSLALRVYAEGVQDGLDAQALWDCEVDGITGPWATSEMIKP